MSAATPTSSKQNDGVLWLAGAVVAGIGVVWLLIASPWSGSKAPAPTATTASVAHQPAGDKPTAGTSAAQASTGDGKAKTSLTSSLSSQPLRMAELAYQAGMLVEPEEYSAWALYRKVLAEQPDNAKALAGLNKIAGELLKRGNAALGQGRYDDALATAKRIQEALPDNIGARELSEMVARLKPKPEPKPEPEPVVAKTPAPAKPEVAPAPAKPAPPPVDQVAKAHDGFVAAMQAGHLLTPASTSAKHFVGVMLALAPSDPRSQQARTQLFNKFLGQADTALAQKDTDAAETWLDEAGSLGVDSERVATARQQLTDHLIAIESARRMPISTFNVVHYVPPAFPDVALRRGIGGWVDVEFTVARDGTTQNVTVTDTKNGRYFKEAAVKAVSQWRFEPHEFRGQDIAQQTYTRINFTFDDSPSR